MDQGFSFQDSQEIQQDAVDVSATHQNRGREQARGSSNEARGRGRGRGRGGHHGHSGNRGIPTHSQQRPPSLQRGNSDYPQVWELFDIILNDYRGKARLNDIRRLFPGTASNNEIKEWFGKAAHMFNVFEDNSGRITFISVRCMARLCGYYGDPGCRNVNCKNFHLCKDYMDGDCKYGNGCPQSHNFHDQHNDEVAKGLHLTKYNDNQRRCIARQSLLQVCGAYNNQSCKLDDACSYLHACEEFVMKGNCEKEQCLLDHSFDSEHTKRLLNQFKVDRICASNISLFRRSIIVKKLRASINLSRNVQVRPRDRTSYHTDETGKQSTSESKQVNRRPRDGSAKRAGPSKPARQHSCEPNNQNVDDPLPDERSIHRESSLQGEHNMETSPKEIWAGPRSSGSTPAIIKPLMDLHLGESKQYKSSTSRSRDRVLIPNAPQQVVESKTPSIPDSHKPASRYAKPLMNMHADESGQCKSPSKYLDKDRGERGEYLSQMHAEGEEGKALLAQKDHKSANSISHYVDEKPIRDVNSEESRRESSSTYRNRERELLEHSSQRHPKYNVLSTEGSHKSGNSFSQYICEKYLLYKSCPGCTDFHYDKAYAWFANMFDDWYQMHSTEEDDLETAYQKPEEDSRHIMMKLPGLKLKALVNFNTFTAHILEEGDTVKIKRMAVESARWKWYIEKPGSVCSALQSNHSDYIERRYKKDSDAGFKFTSSSQGKTYMVELHKRQMTVLDSNETFPLKRRPDKC